MHESISFSQTIPDVAANEQVIVLGAEQIRQIMQEFLIKATDVKTPNNLPA